MTESIWFHTASIPAAPRLDRDLTADVVVVGAGVAGVNAALDLATAGRKVVVLDARSIAHGETGHTTAHLSTAIDGGWKQMRKSFGTDQTREIARFARRGIDRILEQIVSLEFDANRNVVDAWVVTETEDQVDSLRKETDASNEVGIEAEFSTSTPWKRAVAGIRYPNQARIQPVAYIQGLRRHAESLGVSFYEHARVVEVRDGEPCSVRVADGHTVTASTVVVTANVPFNDRVVMHTKLWAWRTYAIALELDRPVFDDALIFDSEDPYHYVRLAKWKEGHALIVGGEDHRTGTDEQPGDRWDALERWIRERYDPGQRVAQWSGQIIETPDGAPFVGRNPGDTHVWIGTGWIGQGITFGAAGGELLARLILGQSDPLEKIFDPSRKPSIGEMPHYVKRNLEFPKGLILDRVISADVEATGYESIGTGEGKIIEDDGKKVAAYRRDDGSLVKLSPVCPHLKCDVHWNAAETSWDCPCHGSRFTAEGDLLNGPACAPLERMDD